MIRSQSAKWVRRDVVVLDTFAISGQFTNEPWMRWAEVIIPPMDIGKAGADIGLELSLDQGATWFPAIDPADGQDLILVSNLRVGGVSSIAVDITLPLRGFGNNERLRARFTTPIQAIPAIDRTLSVILRG